MQSKEWSKIWHDPRLEVGFLQAHYVQHAYPRHSHDYYVVAVVERGVQSFTYQGTKHITLPGGVILLNPGAAHTGEPAAAQGFEYRALYPTAAHLETTIFELTGQQRALPYFTEVRVNQPWATQSILALHQALVEEADILECEARFTWTLAQLIKHYAHNRTDEQRLGKEQKTIQRARRYIDENFAQGISLSQLAEHVSLSPYYLLRVFCAEVGMPPYTYLESVRIRQAQRLIEAGQALVEVALAVGFSSQSHFTRRFKQIIGVTPGQYAQQVRKMV